MTSCELCRMPARTYCDSDQASLCWECDAKVHGANFLVARHLRTLLCHACQSQTPWKASGVRLGNTVSVCEACAAGGMNVINDDEEEESEAGNDDDMDTEDDRHDDEEEEEEEDEEEVGGDELDADNQVVPWSSSPPPTAASSSSSEESVSRCHNKNDRVNASGTIATISLKRRRASNVNFKDGQNCSSSKGRGHG